MNLSERIDTSEFMALPDLIREHAQLGPDKPALTHGDGWLSYANLDARIDRAAAALQRDGVKPKDVVAICASSSTDYIVLYMAALRVGAAACPLSPSASPAQLDGMIADCGAQLLFLDTATTETLNKAGAPASKASRISLEGSEHTKFDDWLAPPGAKPEPVEIDPSWPFNLIYSSGTTGNPKGIVQSHQMRWGHIRRSQTQGYGADTVTLASTPLYSNTTLVSVIPTLARGGALILMRKFNALEFLKLAEKNRVTHAMLVPVQYRRIMDLEEFDSFDLSAFKMKTCTSAPFAAELKADILKRWPGGLVEFYGMTEGGGTCVLAAHEHPDKLHTVGQPAEGHVVKVIDENGQELPFGEQGEVVGRSPAMMTGYHNQPEKTAEAEWFSPEGERYIRTGDIGRFDADGFMILGDRKKDMIISGGFNIYPADLEQALSTHPDVSECAVVGVPSREWGETPAAFVVLRKGGKTDPDSLQQWANENLGRMQKIRHIRIVDALPRSAIGKVLKRELRETFNPANQ